MTLTFDISPEMEARFEEEAASRGQTADEYVREAFRIWLSLVTPETEAEFSAGCKALALPTLQEYWDNEKDAVYDNF